MSKPAQHIVATILGCGSSGGVPRIGNDWGVCDPSNPKNRRTRCSLLITGTRDDMPGQTNIIIDTGCDLREQLLATGIHNVDAVFYTHEHADHTHGIDDLRALALINSKRVDCYMSQPTHHRLLEAFRYCFVAPEKSEYPPILNAHITEAGQTTTIDGDGGTIDVLAFLQDHGNIDSFGYRVGNFAYSCDLSGIPDETLPFLDGLDYWVIDALRYRFHPSHLNLEQSLALIEKLGTRNAILTNLHVDFDYEALSNELPSHIAPAFDGMRIKFPQL